MNGTEVTIIEDAVRKSYAERGGRRGGRNGRDIPLQEREISLPCHEEDRIGNVLLAYDEVELECLLMIY